MRQHWKAVTKEIVSRQVQTMHLHSCPFYRPRNEQDLSHGISKFTLDRPYFRIDISAECVRYTLSSLR